MAHVMQTGMVIWEFMEEDMDLQLSGDKDSENSFRFGGLPVGDVLYDSLRAPLSVGKSSKEDISVSEGRAGS